MTSCPKYDVNASGPTLVAYILPSPEQSINTAVAPVFLRLHEYLKVIFSDTLETITITVSEMMTPG
jgi:hypothetical protein